MPSRFEQVERLFRAALRIEPTARAAFLERECGHDDALRSEIEALLAEDGATGALDRPLVGDFLKSTDLNRLLAREREPPPERIAGYRIVQTIGEGGMGIVYEAEQDNPRRTVAIKVLKDISHSAEASRRFALEAQVLGRLQHPGIAQIFEAGTFATDAGVQPFLAMEFVRGDSLTRHAEKHALTTRDRLEIIARTCDALQHAHQRGIIHRDLKPANIMMVREADDRLPRSPQPKILDFGVARATDLDQTDTDPNTTAGQLVGTLSYMSPEQASCAWDDLDTRSDVYSLGVVAYELLTGRLPYEVRDRTPFEAARVIREVDAAPASSIERSLAGDVDTIVAKAIEKDRSQRYQSASELAADIRRHLRDEPIAARPHSTWYHLSKLARRHLVATMSLAIAVAVTLAGVIGIAVALANATRERNESTRQAAIALAITEFLDEDLLGSADPDVSEGRDLTVREVLDSAAKRIDARFANQPEVEAAIRSTIGRTYRRLGDLTKAEPHLARALELRRLIVGAGSKDDANVITSMNELAKLYTLQGRVEDAEALEREVLAAKRRTLGDAHQSTIISMHNLASDLRTSGQREEALALHEEAYALAARHLAKDSPYRVIVTGGLGSMYRDLHRYDEAEPLLIEALQLSRQIHGDTDTHTLRLMNSLAILYQKVNRLDEAERLLEEAIRAQSERVGRRHPNVLAYMSNLGDLYRESGRLADAASLLSETLDASREVLGADHRGTLTTMAALARVELALDHRDRAEALMLEALEGWTRRTGNDSRETKRARALAVDAYRAWGREADALRMEAPISAP